MRFALMVAVLASLIALGLNVLGSKTIEWCTGVQPSDQEMVKFFLDPAMTLWYRSALIFSVVIVAPVLEELYFRGVIFRGFASKLPVGAAVAVSGFIFALVHFNAASMVALWFLGMVFAWLYSRTRTILAPMTLHCFFNSLNVLLLIFFPELGQL